MVYGAARNLLFGRYRHVPSLTHDSRAAPGQRARADQRWRCLHSGRQVTLGNLWQTLCVAERI